MSKSENDNHHDDKRRVAGGAGAAFLGRLGAIIEAVSVIAFTWAYGAEVFGLFAVLWSYVKVTTAISDAAMTTALQRFVPKGDEAQANAAVGNALKLSMLLSVVFALAPEGLPSTTLTTSSQGLHYLPLVLGSLPQ